MGIPSEKSRDSTSLLKKFRSKSIESIRSFSVSETLKWSWFLSTNDLWIRLYILQNKLICFHSFIGIDSILRLSCFIGNFQNSADPRKSSRSGLGYKSINFHWFKSDICKGCRPSGMKPKKRSGESNDAEVGQLLVHKLGF